MGLFSHTSKKKSERVLIISIGSATVAGAFVSIEAGISTVLSTVVSDITVLSDLTLARFEKEMEKALLQTLKGLSKLRAPSPDRTVIFFSSPWYASQVRLAKMTRPTPFVITKALINDIISRELKAFEDEEIKNSGGKGEILQAIESKVIQVKLNGYPTSDPINVSAAEIEIALFLAVAKEEMLIRIEGIVQAEYHRPVAFSSFLSASFIVTRDFFPRQEEYLLIDIGGEVADITLVRDSALIQSMSIPLGRNFLLRKLSIGLGRSVPEAVSLCTLYLEDKVEASIKDACSKILAEAKEEWLKAFQQALFSISNELSIPDTIFLSVNADVERWFIDAIRHEKFNQYALTEKEFNVIVLNPEVFHGALAYKENVERNACILIEALACTRLAEHARSADSSGSFVQQLVRS